MSDITIDEEDDEQFDIMTFPRRILLAIVIVVLQTI